MELGRRKLIAVVMYFIAYGLLSALYLYDTSPRWAYMGLITSINVGKVLASLAALATMVVFTPGGNGVRAALLNIYLAIYILPSLIIFGLADKPLASAVSIWLSVVVVYGVSAINFPPIRIPRIKVDNLPLICSTLGGATILVYTIMGGWRYFNLDLSRVYDFREEAASNLPPAFAYLTFTFSGVIVPLGIASSLRCQKYGHLIFSLALSVVMFGFTSQKSILFLPAALLVIHFNFKEKFNQTTIVRLLALVLLAGVFGWAIYKSIPSFPLYSFYETMFVRRALFIPVIVDYDYIDFFSRWDKFYWATSKVTMGLVANPYGGESSADIIGDAYFSRGVHANSGMIGSGYAQAGLAGSMLYSAAVGIVVAIFQSYSRVIGKRFVFVLAFGLVYKALVTSDFLTVLITHGLLITLLVLPFIHDDNRAFVISGGSRD